MHETIDIPNFLTPNELQETIKRVYDNTDGKTEFIDKWGVWKGQYVSTQHWVAKDKIPFVFSIIEEKLKNILSLPFTIEKGQILQANLGSDLHTDYAIRKNHKEEELVGNPYYTLIIPHNDYDSHTVVFKEHADYNDFYMYKEKNDPIENHVNDEDWQKYCSHCWAEDQTYVTLDKACAWTQGKLLGFDRRRWHCSDNFKGKLDLKEGFVLWLREKDIYNAR